MSFDFRSLKVAFTGPDSLSTKLNELSSTDREGNKRSHCIVEDGSAFRASYRAAVFFTEQEMKALPRAQRSFEGIERTIDLSAGEMAWLVQQDYVFEDEGNVCIDLKKTKSNPQLKL